MLKYLFTILLAIIPLSISAGIVNNSGTTAADSVSFEFFLLDSAGHNMLQLAAEDSVWLHVYYPGGELAYRDSVAGNAATITETANSNFYTYTWQRVVADIDGSGVDGVYKFVVTAKDISLTLSTPSASEFQLYQTQDYNTWADYTIDSLQALLDSIQNQDDWVAKEATLANVEDTVNAIIDTVQNQDDWIAQEVSLLAAIDSINAIIDSIQNQSTWVAKEASLFDGNLNLTNTTGSLSAAKFAADCFTFSNFTGTAAFWNEGKTGYTAAVSDKTGFSLVATEWAEVWRNQDTTHVDTSAIGTWMTNNLAVAGALSAADIIAIADTIFGRDSSDVNAGAATSFGTLLMKATYVQGAAASGIDSTILSNVLHRIVWGTAVGSGSDSSTIAQRDVTIAAILNDVITAAAIATDAIGASELASDAIGSDQLAASAAAEIEDSVYANRADYRADVSALATSSALADVQDTVTANRDSLQSHDDWVAREASLSDTLATTFVDDLLTRIADSIWLSLLANRDGVAGSFGDSAQTWGSTGGGSDTASIKIMLYNNLFARLSQDTTIQITDSGYVIIAAVNENTDTIARLGDSTSFQGTASGLTVQQIVDGVWDELQSAHTIAGTFGKYLDTEVSGVSSPAGSGAFTITWILLDTTATPDSTVQAASLFVNNVAQSSTPYHQITDNNGQASFNLDAGTWVIFTNEPGYSTNVDTFVVSGAVTDTLMVYQTTGDLTTVAFDLRMNTGSFLASAKIRIELISVNDSILSYDGNMIFTPWIVEDTANTSGLAEVPLYPNSLFTNDSTYYNVTIYDKRRRRPAEKFRMRVPVSDSVVYVQNVTRWIAGH